MTTPDESVLAAIPSVASLLDEADRALLVEHSRLRQVKSGETLIVMGDAVEALLVVQEGRLAAEVPSTQGQPLVVERYFPGDYCAEISLLKGDRASASVRAVVDGSVWAIPHAVLRDLMARYPEITRTIAVEVARKLSATNRRVGELPLAPGIVLRSSGTEWSQAVVSRVVSEIARHAQGPVLFLGGPLPASVGNVHELPSLAQLAEGSASVADYEPFLKSTETAVGFVDFDAENGSGRAWHQLLRRVRRSSSPAVINVRGPGQLPAFEDRMTLVNITEETGFTSGSGNESYQTVLLRAGDLQVRPGQLATLSNRLGTEIIRVIPGGLSRLTRETGKTDNEPGASMAWLARHVLGMKVGLAFGAGSSKGYAHLGVIEELQAAGIEVDAVAGTSVGAPIAASVAHRVPPEDTKELLDRTLRRAKRITLPFRSLLSSGPLRRDLQALTEDRQFQDLELPLATVAVDFALRRERVFHEGDVAQALLASMAIPGVFPPVDINGVRYVDGGLVNPVPVSAATFLGADIVIAVKLSGPVGQEHDAGGGRFRLRRPPIIDTLLGAFEVMQEKVTAESATRADVMIVPKFEGPTGLADYVRGSEFIELGRSAFGDALPEIRRRLPWVG